MAFNDFGRAGKFCAFCSLDLEGGLLQLRYNPQMPNREPHPYLVQLLAALADIYAINQAGLSWDFIGELLHQVLDIHEAEALIFMDSCKRRWLCFSVANGRVVDSTVAYFPKIVLFVQAPRDQSCNAAFVKRDGSLAYLYDDGFVL